MVSLDDPLHSLSADSSPRISFSSEFLDESNFITICPNPQAEREREAERARAAARNVDFEFLSAGNLTDKMITADELIYEGKLLPFWKIHHAEKLNMVSLKSEDGADEASSQEIKGSKLKEESSISWFIDDDPSPRPPKCTVLWKELLKLKKQRPSTLSPSISSSSSSSSSSSRISVADIPSGDERKERNMREKVSSKRTKKGQERERNSRSVSIRIRPVLNVPICTAVAAKNASALPPLFSLRKGKLDRC